MKQTITESAGEVGEGVVEEAMAMLDRPGPGRPDRTRFRRGRAAAVLVVALLALAAGAGGWQWKQLHDAASARAQALDAARRIAVVVASYDHRDYDAYTEAVLEVATGSFADRFAKRKQDLRTVVEQADARVEAHVVDAAVRSLSDGKAVVLLFVDQTLNGGSTGEESTDGSRMTMTLVRSEGAWLVSEIKLR